MDNNKLFVYGILKRGYELDLSEYGAKFVSEAHIQGADLYGIGPDLIGLAARPYHGVGLRLNEDPKRVAYGELWEIPDNLWPWLDQCEQNGFCYTRKIEVVTTVLPNLEGLELQPAWVYEHTFPGFRYENLIESGRF